MSDPRPACARLAAAAVAVLLAAAPLGQGGRAASALLVHQTLLAGVVLTLAWSAPGWLREQARLALAVAAFALYAYLLAPYRYRALLLLVDIVAASVVYALARLAREAPRGRSLVLLGLAAAALLSAASAVVERAAGLEVAGLFGNPRHAAALIGSALLGLAGYFLAARPRAPSGRLPGLLAAAGLVLGALAVLGLEARGTLLGLGVGALALAALLRRPVLLVLPPLLLALLLVLPNPLGARLRAAAGDDPYRYGRLGIWRAAGRMIADRAWLGGVGLGGFERAGRRYNFAVPQSLGRYAKYPNHAHCEYLEALAETSLPGLLLLLAPALLALPRLRQREKLQREDVAAAAALAGLMAHAAVDAVLHSPANLYVYAALGGLLAAPRRAAAPPAPTPAPERPLRALVVLFTLAGWLQAALLPWLADRAHLAGSRSGSPASRARARALVPGSALYQAAWGRACLEQFQRAGDLAWLDAARLGYEEAVRRDPQDARLWRSLGGLYHQVVLGALPAAELGQRAREAYSRALELDPFNVFLRIERAGLEGALGRPREAERDALRAVELEPEFRAGWAALARARGELGDRAGAAAAEARVAEIDRQWAGKRIDHDYESALVGAGPLLEPRGSDVPRANLP